MYGRDSYEHIHRTSKTFQDREAVVDEVWPRGAEWAQQKNSLILTPASSCGEGDSFTVWSQNHGDFAGCYTKMAKHNGEALYTSENRMGKKYMVAAVNFNETNASPDVRDLENVDELYLEHFHALC